MLINVCLPFQRRKQKALLNRFCLRQIRGANHGEVEFIRGTACSAVTKYHRPGALSNRSLFPHSSGVWNPGSRCQQGQFLVRSLFLDYRGLASHCVLARPGGAGGEWGRLLSDVSSYTGTHSHVRTSSKPIISQRPHRQIPSHWGLGSSTHEFREDESKSITGI